MRRRAILLVAVMITAILVGSAAVAYAQAPVPKDGPITIQNHSWNGYHWARTSNPFTLKVGDNATTSAWDSSLATTSADWSLSTVLDTPIVAGRAKGKNCRPTSGQVEVCNATYGNNGWLGIASVWVTGGTHITQGTAKLNDTYFNTPTYNTSAWRNLVMCQEVAHTFGLDHQDETFDNPNLGTCMDYTNDPDGGAGGASPNDPGNEHPNAHDYDELEVIYAHLDSTTTIGANAASKHPAAMNGIDTSNPKEWGKLIHKKGKHEVYEKDFGRGNKVRTWVIRP
jgi:hypothetical protein